MIENNFQKEIKNIFLTFIGENASDIHFKVNKSPMRRINNQLFEANGFNKLKIDDVFYLIKILAGEERLDMFLKDKELDFSAFYLSKRLRGNAFFENGSPYLVLRMIATEIEDLEKLGLPDLSDILSKKDGLIILSGASGNGKSTTASSIINFLNRNKRLHILTIEDPIETVYTDQLSTISQREVGVDTFSVEESLRQAMREDVDVIFVGEIRNKKEAEIVLHASQIGKLVITTLQSNNSASAIETFIDFFSSGESMQARRFLSNNLIAVIYQKLIKTNLNDNRVLSYELIKRDPAVSNFIISGDIKGILNYLEIASSKGMVSLNESLFSLVQKNKITMNDAIANSYDTESLKKVLGE